MNELVYRVSFCKESFYGMLCYGISMLCYEICVQCNAIVYVGKDKHSANVTMRQPPRWRRVRAFDSHAGDRVRFPVATDLSREKWSDSSTAKRSATGVIVTGPRRSRPVSQQV